MLLFLLVYTYHTRGHDLQYVPGTAVVVYVYLVPGTREFHGVCCCRVRLLLFLVYQVCVLAPLLAPLLSAANTMDIAGVQ